MRLGRFIHWLLSRARQNYTFWSFLEKGDGAEYLAFSSKSNGAWPVVRNRCCWIFTDTLRINAAVSAVFTFRVGSVTQFRARFIHSTSGSDTRLRRRYRYGNVVQYGNKYTIKLGVNATSRPSYRPRKAGVTLEPIHLPSIRVIPAIAVHTT